MTREPRRGLAVSGMGKKTLAVAPHSQVGMGWTGRFRSITVTIWLYWDLGSLEAGSKPLALCHVLWAIIDWCLCSGWAHHAEQGQSHGDGGPAFVDDTVRRSTCSTIIGTGAMAASAAITTTFILLSLYTPWLGKCVSTGNNWAIVNKPGHDRGDQLPTNMDLWSSLVFDDDIKHKTSQIFNNCHEIRFYSRTLAE